MIKKITKTKIKLTFIISLNGTVIGFGSNESTNAICSINLSPQDYAKKT